MNKLTFPNRGSLVKQPMESHSSFQGLKLYKILHQKLVEHIIKKKNYAA
jgi:hypothetical protein